MLRTLGRTACIVLVAGIVAGALYLFIGRGGPTAAQERRRPPDAASFDGRPGHWRGGGRWEGRSTNHGERGGREEASLGHGVAGMLGTAVQVGIVGAVVVGLQRRRRRHGRQQRGAS